MADPEPLHSGLGGEFPPSAPGCEEIVYRGIAVLRAWLGPGWEGAALRSACRRSSSGPPTPRRDGARAGAAPWRGGGVWPGVGPVLWDRRLGSPAALEPGCSAPSGCRRPPRQPRRVYSADLRTGNVLDGDEFNWDRRRRPVREPLETNPGAPRLDRLELPRLESKNGVPTCETAGVDRQRGKLADQPDGSTWRTRARPGGAASSAPSVCDLGPARGVRVQLTWREGHVSARSAVYEGLRGSSELHAALEETACDDRRRWTGLLVDGRLVCSGVLILVSGVASVVLVGALAVRERSSSRRRTRRRS